MKNLIIIFLILFSMNLFASGKKGKEVDIYFNNTYLDSMTFVEFQTLVDTADLYKELKEIEDAKNIKIEIEDEPWVLEVGKTFTTFIKIIWFDKDNVPIKKLKLKADFIIPQKDGIPKCRMIYRDISEVGFPVSVVLNIVLLIILGMVVQ